MSRKMKTAARTFQLWDAVALLLVAIALWVAVALLLVAIAWLVNRNNPSW